MAIKVNRIYSVLYHDSLIDVRACLHHSFMITFYYFNISEVKYLHCMGYMFSDYVDLSMIIVTLTSWQNPIFFYNLT